MFVSLDRLNILEAGPVWRTGRIHTGGEMERGHPGQKEGLQQGCKVGMLLAELKGREGPT